MKVLDVIRGDGGKTGWRVLPDNVLLKGQNPFFLPDFEGGVRAHPGIAVRIGRLGKGIAPRFARRYVAELAPAFIFRADDYAVRLRRSGLPDSAAYAFDKAVVPFGFHPFPQEVLARIDFRIPVAEASSETDDTLRTGPSTEGQTDAQICGAEELIRKGIELLSRDNTLRMGDFILFSAPGPGVRVEVGDKPELEMTITGTAGERLLQQSGKLRIL